MDTLGDRINHIRKKNRLTQAEFGTLLGISQTHVSKIEKNIENPSETLLLFISYKFVVDITWLKTGEEDKETRSSYDGAMNGFRQAVYLFESFERELSNEERWSAADAYFKFSKLMEAPKIPYEVRYPFYEDIGGIMTSLLVLFREIKDIAATKHSKANAQKVLDKKMRSEKSINHIAEEIRQAVNNMIENSRYGEK